MRRHTVLAHSHSHSHSHSHRSAPTARRVTRGGTFSRNVVRSNVVLPARQYSPAAIPSSVPTGFQPDPYLDYGRFLTAEGGVRIIYKDHDERFRHTLWRACAWTSFTMLNGTYLYARSPLQSPWIKCACFIAATFINWLVVRPPVEVYRTIEIRPDGMMIDDQEVFWLRFMENWPSFRPDKKDSKKDRQVLCGIYGTRFVEFLTVRRFDDNDRMPEIFAAHFQDAMKQLWTGLH
jgi:hypothetical protein